MWIEVRVNNETSCHSTHSIYQEFCYDANDV